MNNVFQDIYFAEDLLMASFESHMILILFLKYVIFELCVSYKLYFHKKMCNEELRLPLSLSEYSIDNHVKEIWWTLGKKHWQFERYFLRFHSGSRNMFANTSKANWFFCIYVARAENFNKHWNHVSLLFWSIIWCT